MNKILLKTKQIISIRCAELYRNDEELSAIRYLVLLEWEIRRPEGSSLGHIRLALKPETSQLIAQRTAKTKA